MVLKEDSVLKYLPIGIEKRQLLILDSLRFTLEMIDYGYEQLYQLLLKTSLAGKRVCNLSEIFIHAWNIIDNTKRFYSLYKKMPSDNDYQNVKNLDFLRNFRNTFQHIDQRIDESIMKNEKPIYGTLKWEYKDIEGDKVMNCIAISGINLYTKNHPFYFSDLSQSKKEVNNIILETVDTLEMKEVNISELINDLEKITFNLEMQLEEKFKEKQLQKIDWTKRKDIILFMKNE